MTATGSTADIKDENRRVSKSPGGFSPNIPRKK